MKKSKSISIVLILIAFLIIGLGIYINNISNPKTITKNFIDELTTSIKNSFIPIQQSPIKNNYTISSNFSIETTTTNNNKFDLFITKLNNISATTKYIQNKSDKKLFFQINSIKDNKDFLTTKYLIKNATRYASISNVTNKYINYGANNYFEVVNTTPNYIYIYDQMVFALKENLKDEYFSSTSTVTTINDKKDKYYQITMNLNNSALLELCTSIFNALKKDQNSSILLNTFLNGFSDYKIPKDALSNIKNIKLNLYTNKTYQINKIEFVIKLKDHTYTTAYETNNIGYFIKDGRLIYKFNVENSTTTQKINILNSLEKQVGQIYLNQTSDKYELLLDLDDSKSIKIKYNFISSNKLSDDKTSYQNNATVDLAINYLTKNTYTNLKFNIDSIISDVYTIEEITDDAILKSSLTEVEQNNINAYLQNGIYKIFEYKGE